MSKEIPSIEQLRESQRQGSIGQGTQSEDYGSMESDFNEGGGQASEEKPTITNNADGFDPWTVK
jgi:hypothetical protein